MHTFQLKSLLLFVTLVAVCLGVNYWVPGVGYVLLAVALPAAVRTHWIVGKRLLQGEESSVLDQVEVFAMSCLVILGVGIASLFAFSGAAFLGLILGSSVMRSIDSAMLFSIAVGIVAVGLLWWQIGRFMFREN
jgi:hypothetical protein